MSTEGDRKEFVIVRREQELRAAYLELRSLFSKHELSAVEWLGLLSLAKDELVAASFDAGEFENE